MSRDIKTVFDAFMRAIEAVEDAELKGAELSSVARERIESEIRYFVGLCEREGRGEEWSDEELGVDLWFSRNIRGTGFVIRGRHDGEWLGKMARATGTPCGAYLGEDGLIYLT